MEKRQNDKTEETDAFEAMVLSSVHDAFWRVPTTIDEVGRFEDEISGNPNLQFKVADFDIDSVLAKGRRAKLQIVRQFENVTSFEENLAQAAREGSVISPETARQMRIDRLRESGHSDS